MAETSRCDRLPGRQLDTAGAEQNKQQSSQYKHL